MKRKKRKVSFVHYAAVLGCVSTGLMYAAIGVVAMLSFLQIKDGGADEASLLVYLDNYVAGKVAVWIVLLGMLGYIVWRIYETIYDPYDYGHDANGLVKRTGVALSSLADALIALSAVQALTGWGGVEENGIPRSLRHAVEQMMDQGRSPLILTAGIITIICALVQVGYAFLLGYVERMHFERLNHWQRYVTHALAWIGHLARGIILSIVGISFIRAVVTKDATFVVNTDKAFDFIGDNVGHAAFIAVAVGTVFYGLFMFVFGVYYDTDKAD